MFFCERINFSHNIGKDFYFYFLFLITLTTEDSKGLKAEISHQNNPHRKEVTLSVSSKNGLEKHKNTLYARMSEQNFSLSF